VFDRVRRECGTTAFHHVVAVEGDIQRPGLGLSTEDRATLTASVNIIFHVAATVRFDERLKPALQTNLGGTYSVVQLARELQNLKVCKYVYSPQYKISKI
jgi:fatty acyl-CoA reductase